MTARALRVVTATDSLEPAGGIEVCVFEDATALAALGHSVEVLFGQDGSQHDAFTAGGVAVRGTLRFGFDPSHAVADLAAFVRAGFRIARSKPDVIWLNRPENIIWAQVVSRMARVPLVVHLHHAPNYPRHALLMTGVARYIAVSEYIKSVWVERGIPGDRVDVVPNAVRPGAYPPADDARRRSAREALDLPEGVRVVMCFGRVTRDKGVVTVLEAWNRLALEPSRARLVVVGDIGPGDTEMTELFDRLPAESVVHLPHRRDVVSLLHAADLVVAPSWEPESFGRTTVEAMSAEIPAIASDLGGSAEILRDGMERFLVPPRDSGALAELVAATLDWRETEPGLGADARAHVERRFPYGAHVEAISRILVSHRSRRSARAAAAAAGTGVASSAVVREVAR